MTVFRVPKHENFTVMSNHHLQNKDISLKAKGLMSLMLSLPDNWDYTQAGLASICRDGIDSIRAAVIELEKNGYLKRRRIRDENGRFNQTEYAILEKPDERSTILEKPILENPILENPTLEKPILEKPAQLNTNRLNTNKLNTNESNTNLSIRDGSDGAEKPVEFNAIEEKERRIAYEKVLKSNIEYQNLIHDRPHDKGRIDELILIILDFLFYQKELVVIGDLEVPAEVVRSRLFHLNREHIEYVLFSLDQNHTEIRNIRKYLLSALYHAPSTIDSYYIAKVGADQP